MGHADGRVPIFDQMSYWLLKTEPTSYGIEDLRRDTTTAWEGVRNYQARNFMRDMRVGDKILFYHSSCDVPGVYGVAKVVAPAHADATQFNKKDSHYDPKATKAKPIWECVDIGFSKAFKSPVTLAAIRREPKLRSMVLLAPGSRLSVQPVTKEQFEHIAKMA
jgi:predicted RNA-binding protein with PUA-like domain